MVEASAVTQNLSASGVLPEEALAELAEEEPERIDLDAETSQPPANQKLTPADFKQALRPATVN